MDAHYTGGITIDLSVTASQCRTLARGGSIILKDETLEFKKGVKTTVVKRKDFDDDGADLSNKYRNECESYGWTNRKTFEGHVQDVVLKVRTKAGKVMSKDGLQLPCPLEDLECDTTSFDPYAYTWDDRDNCLLEIHRKEDVNMIKQGKNNYYNVSGRNSTSQYLFEVRTKPEVFCNKPVPVYPTNYDALYVVIDFGDSIWLRENEWDSQAEHNTHNTTSLQFRLTPNYSYTNLSHPIQIILTQKHLIIST